MDTPSKENVPSPLNRWALRSDDISFLEEEEEEEEDKKERELQIRKRVAILRSSSSLYRQSVAK